MFLQRDPVNLHTDSTQPPHLSHDQFCVIAVSIYATDSLSMWVDVRRYTGDESLNYSSDMDKALNGSRR